MSFNGTEGAPISIEEAKNLITTYKVKFPSGVNSVFIGKDNIAALLNRPGSMGIRVYFATDANNNNTIAMVSATANQDDDLGLIINKGIPCPPMCPSVSLLNGL